MIRKLSAILGAGALTLGLAACGAGDGGGDGDMGTITMGYIPSWTDGLATAYVLEDQLEQMGYTVEHQTLSEAGALYAGLANGDVDVYPSAWPEQTHASYMEQYQDGIEDLGTYYADARLNFAVPEYVDINSIAELQGAGDRFGGQIIGIEPGAGITEATQESVIPGYGLDGEYELTTSSTTAMLAELQTAIDNEEEIVVTLWTPFWAMSSFPVKELEDPEGHFGEAEGLHFLATTGFSEEFPEAADFIGQIEMNNDEFGSLENLIVNEYDEGQEAEAVDQWLEENPDVLPSIEG